MRFILSTIVTVCSSLSPGFELVLQRDFSELPRTQNEIIRQDILNAFSSLPQDVSELVRGQSLSIEESVHRKFAAHFVYPDKSDWRLVIKVHPSTHKCHNRSSFMYHEFFHAIHFLINPTEHNWVTVSPNKHKWIREGLAEYFAYIVSGRKNSTYIKGGFGHPSTSLTHPPIGDELGPAHYGHQFLYFYYLFRECGQDLFWKIAKGVTGARGELNIDIILSQYGPSLPQCRSFNDSVVHFELAKFKNHLTRGDNPNIHFLWTTGRHRKILGKLGEMCKPYSPTYDNLSEDWSGEVFGYMDGMTRISLIEKDYPWNVYGVERLLEKCSKLTDECLNIEFELSQPIHKRFHVMSLPVTPPDNLCCAL